MRLPFFLSLFPCCLLAVNWQENLRPKLFFSMSSRDYTAFIGNLSAPDHFTGMLYAEDPDGGGGGPADPPTDPPRPSSPSINTPLSSPSPPSAPPPPPPSQTPPGMLLLAAKNLVYKLSSDELRLTQTLTWPASPAAVDTCRVKGKSRDACNNFIVVMQQYQDDPNRYSILLLFLVSRPRLLSGKASLMSKSQK